MTFTIKLDSNLYVKPGLNALGGARWVYRKISIGTADLVTTQIIAASIISAGHRLLDGFIESTVLDTNGTTAVTLTVGILNSYFGEQPAGTIGTRLKAPTAAPSATANYSSGGVTDTTASPVLVSGQDLITASTVGQAGGRVRIGISTTSYTLTPSYSIGVDKDLDRIVALKFPVAPGTAQAGTILIGLLLDRDQE